jgi:hypothetical protein
VAMVGNLTFEVLLEDVLNPDARGPNGRDCVNNGTKTDGPYDGTNEFDLEYECECGGTGFAGPNCDEAVVEQGVTGAAARSDTLTTPLIAALATIVMLVLVVVAVLRYHRYKAENSPADLSEVQAEIMASLGIGATFDIRSHEFGVTLIVSGISDESPATAAAVEDAVREALHGRIERATRELRSTSLTFKRNSTVAVARLSLDKARVNAEADHRRVLAVFPRPDGVKDGFEEDVVAGLQRAADRGHFKVGDDWAVTEVTIAVPRCVPREVDRSAVVRLNVLGEGNFAEVIKVRSVVCVYVCVCVCVCVRVCVCVCVCVCV